jgi:hypothetical protein
VTEKAYLRAYARRLRDLPWRQRRELVAELEAHLAEFPSDADLVARLGSPKQYAAEMRKAARIERQRGLGPFLRARRPRTLVFSALLLTLLGLAIGALGWVYSYEPLAFTSGSSRTPLGTHGLPGVDGQAVTFHKGKRFDLSMEFENTGRYTVRVIGVGYRSSAPWTARLLMTPPSYNGGYTPPKPFHPFDLRPGQYGDLFLRGVWACHAETDPGATLTLHDFPVRYTFLWRTGTAEIPLFNTLEIQFPKGCHLP